MTASFQDAPIEVAFEITGCPIVPAKGDFIDLPMFDDESDCLNIDYVFIWWEKKYITVSVSGLLLKKDLDDLLSVGWIVRDDTIMHNTTVKT